METPPGSKACKRRSRKQRSYLSGSIAKQQGTLQELQAQYQALQQEQQLLQRRAGAASQGMQVADEALLRLVAARTALARSAQQLQLDTQRFSLTLDSFPPPEVWGPAMATFSSEQLRFITFDMLRLSLHMTRTNPDQVTVKPAACIQHAACNAVCMLCCAPSHLPAASYAHKL